MCVYIEMYARNESKQFIRKVLLPSLETNKQSFLLARVSFREEKEEREREDFRGSYCQFIAVREKGIQRIHHKSSHPRSLLPFNVSHGK
jgi:hypothetical protein